MAKKELFSDVDELVSSLNKELGEGSIMNFGDDKPIISIPRESTGSLVSCPQLAALRSGRFQQAEL